MIPVSNKTRSVTRVRYKHPVFQPQENITTILTAAARSVRGSQHVRLSGVSVRRRRQNEIECGIISRGDD
jgi:hypothetical protein